MSDRLDGDLRVFKGAGEECASHTVEGDGSWANRNLRCQGRRGIWVPSLRAGYAGLSTKSVLSRCPGAWRDKQIIDIYIPCRMECASDLSFIPQ